MNSLGSHVVLKTAVLVTIPLMRTDEKWHVQRPKTGFYAKHSKLIYENVLKDSNGDKSSEVHLDSIKISNLISKLPLLSVY